MRFLLTALLTLTMMTHSIQAQASSDAPKVLVAYFSWGGNTRVIANQIQELTGADMYQIETVKPYSSNYNTCVEEAKVEKAANARPAIKAPVENMEQYDYIFIGYPNWWGTMPMAVLTFIESYKLTGKTLIPFCTHGGGGVQQCFKDFKTHTANYQTIDGFLCNGSSVNSAKPLVERWLRERVKVIK